MWNNIDNSESYMTCFYRNAENIYFDLIFSSKSPVVDDVAGVDYLINERFL